MLFIDANGRKLYAYIASVFGGVNEEVDEPEKAYVAIKNLPEACTLEFDISSNSELIKKIDVTDHTASFFGQRKYIEEVWGESRKLTTQTEIYEALKAIYPDLYSSENEVAVDTTNHKFIQIKQKNQQSHQCVVTEGKFKRIATSDASCKYSLSCSTPGINGLEAMNWIKLEIDLKDNILEKPVRFSIEFSERTQGTVFTPDFTWYFAPPAGHIVSSDSSVKVGSITDKNAIQRVSDETTVYFSEWTEPPESIDERIKSRILFRSLSELEQGDLYNLSTQKKLSVSLHLDNPQGPSNRQFFLGLFIAFLLAFCSDKTRINDFYSCLNLSCSCAEAMCNCRTVCNAVTILAPFLLLLCFISKILPPKKAIPHSGKKHGIAATFFTGIRLVGLVVTILLMIYVYGLWLLFPDIIRNYINCGLNQKILFFGAIVAFLTNAAYLIYCLCFLKRKIYNYI